VRRLTEQVRQQRALAAADIDDSIEAGGVVASGHFGGQSRGNGAHCAGDPPGLLWMVLKVVPDSVAGMVHASRLAGSDDVAKLAN
jgi:hypothetical protein